MDNIVVKKKYERRVRCVDMNRRICKWSIGRTFKANIKKRENGKGETKPDTFCGYITYNLDTFCKMTGDCRIAQ